jgi:hypothetical protein
MSQWSNDAPEHQRLCPFREKHYCAATFTSYRQMLAHCRENHPDRPPFGGDSSTEIVMTDTEGRVLNWEEVGRMLDHPLFWYTPKGTFVHGRESVSISVCPRVIIAQQVGALQQGRAYVW